MMDVNWFSNLGSGDNLALVENMQEFLNGGATLWGISLNGHRNGSPGPSSLYQIDPVTGAGTLIGSNLGYAVNSIAIDPTTGIMYGATTTWSGAFNGLLQIDTNTGTATEIGPFGSFTAIVGLTFDSAGQLWGWHDPGADDPVRINKATGVATTVGNAGISTSRHVLAFDASDTLFLLDYAQPIYTINQVTGAAVVYSPNLGFDEGSGGADFDPATGLLWAARGSGRDVDSWIRITDIAGSSFTDLDTDVQYLNALTWGGSAAAVNTPPVANDDNYNTPEDTPLNIAAPGVLANDTDDDGDPLTAVQDSGTSNGSLTLNADGSFDYTPNPNYCGPDSFTYHANDGTDDSNIAIVSIGVDCVDDAPVAVDDAATVTEDDPATTIDVLANDTDVDGGPISIASVTQPANGTVVITNAGADLTYQPDPDYCNTVAPASTDDFTYSLDPGGSTATVAVTVNCVNDAPVANDDNFGATEDVVLVVAAPGVLANDTDVDGDALSVVNPAGSATAHGTLTLNADGSFTYDPNDNYCGPDSFTYVATDNPPITPPPLESNLATVNITVACVNDPPVVTSVVPGAQTSDYSDNIGTVLITVEDVDDTSTSLTESNEPPLSAAGLTLASTGCEIVDTESPAENGSICTWTYDGQVLDPGDNVHAIVFTPSDSDGDGASGVHTLTIEPEDATVELDGDNDVAVEVPVPDGDSGVFSLFFSAWETLPDAAHGGTAEPGDLNEMVPYMTLIPVGPGGPVDGTCSFIAPTNPADGYGQTAMFDCVFDEVPVNTYEVVAEVWGVSDTTIYYTGFDDGVLVVFDPSLGFTTGGGWFYWPGTADPGLLTCGEDGYPGDKTNFGYNMKYNNKMTNVQGSLLLQRHTVDANCEGAGKYRVKSNRLDGLSIGDATDDSGDYGWAAFSGKSVYSEPGTDGEGNHPFLAYVEDHDDQGCNQDPSDEFWIQVKDKDGNVVLEVNGPDSEPAGDDGLDGDDEPIECGNIIVPHTNKGNK